MRYPEHVAGYQDLSVNLLSGTNTHDRYFNIGDDTFGEMCWDLFEDDGESILSQPALGRFEQLLCFRFSLALTT